MLKTQLLQHFRADAEDRKPKAYKKMEGGNLPEIGSNNKVMYPVPLDNIFSIGVRINERKEEKCNLKIYT